MKRTLIISTALLGALSAPAFAGSADVSYVEPAPIAPVATAPAPVRSADWTGFSLGAQFGYGEVDAEDGLGNNVNGDDGLYGLRAYYDYDFGNYVLGGGLQYDDTDMNLDGAVTADAILRAGGRAGFKFGNSMAYGTAGYSRLYTEDDAVSIGDSDGYFAGIGAETMVSSNVSIGTEVLYQRYEDFDVNGVEAEATTANVFVNYRF